MLLKTARKVVVLVIGGTVVLLGVVMIVTPGPGILGILGGLGILATEFVFARTLLNRMKRKMREFIPGNPPESRSAEAGSPAQPTEPPRSPTPSVRREVSEIERSPASGDGPKAA
ncbi:MAG: PGPGW domain-containing protein [Phycisphaerae bacterium]|nr:MAG: hypothetical protein EDS66_09825 [Planctomycetota bacterium]KAB2949630.1 MAG: hypothetical protein F9K17_02170 [Phycisphaerae bacterium]MBE7456245.1 hypothetical protein [Planctomycetia bacterium]MCK6464794.1 PGPGW domain-containing protein [Phycisphaerae bacterium]MCL4718364.1 PGPGW domain-containing protein [Phycisphaerae bacterium]